MDSTTITLLSVEAMGKLCALGVASFGGKGINVI